MHLPTQKQRLRDATKERLERLSTTDFNAESRSLCKQLLKLLPTEPSVICAYYPIKQEVDIRMALEEILKRGHKLYLPVFEKTKMTYRRAEDLKNLPVGSFHIPEPPKNAPDVVLEEIDYVLLPGRAFDRKGGRLGRGNGGYDKWIKLLKEKNTKAKMWGIALEAQITNEVPMEAHDVPVDAVVTARDFIDCTSPQKR